MVINTCMTADMQLVFIKPFTAADTFVTATSKLFAIKHFDILAFLWSNFMYLFLDHVTVVMHHNQKRLSGTFIVVKMFNAHKLLYPSQGYGEFGA